MKFQQPLFQRLRSGEGTPSAPEALAIVAAAADGGAVHAAALATALAGEKHSEKDLALDSEGELGSPSEGSDDDGEDLECGVCLDAAVGAGPGADAGQALSGFLGKALPCMVEQGAEQGGADLRQLTTRCCLSPRGT